jgi:hypothetical protein
MLDRSAGKNGVNYVFIINTVFWVSQGSAQTLVVEAASLIEPETS